MNKKALILGWSLVGTAAMGTAMATTAQQAHHASQMHNPVALLNAERAAMQPFKSMAGVWRGTAHMTLPSGQKHTIVQTERVGPFLDGAVMVMEGRGYESDGRVGFNALGIISYQPSSKSYTMRAYAQGHAGDFTLKPTGDGFTWDIKAGPVTMTYTATIKGGVWHEVGVRKLPNGKTVPFFEMTLKHVGDTDWPAAGAVPFKH